MIKGYFLLASATALLSPALSQTSTASDCVLFYNTAKLTEGFDFCRDTEAFAVCIANAPSSVHVKSAETLLSNAQQDSRINCDFKVAPTIKVVDRELRVVTQEDVRFQRFRRDDVGVFELKGMIENNTDRIAKTEATIKDTLDDALIASASAAEDNKAAGAALASRVDGTVASIASVDAKADATDAALTKLAQTVKEQKEEQDDAAAKQVSPAAVWWKMANPIHPTNRPESVGVRVLGKNFQQYHHAFNLNVPLFLCTFTNVDDKDATVVVDGWTVARPDDLNPLYHEVNCPSPTKQEKKVTFRLTIQWVDADGAVNIPFKGKDKNDLVLFDMTWSKIEFKDTNVFAEVDGLDQNAKYTCRYTQADNDEIVKNTDAKFVPGSTGNRLLCGKQPTGFAIDKKGYSTVKFAIVVKGSKIFASFAGADSEGPEVKLNICNNGVLDDDETDVDCGGICVKSGKVCGILGKCKAHTDCANGICGEQGKCGHEDGTSQKKASLTCKTIKIEYPDSPNGFYWVMGPHEEFKNSPKKVYCWQTDRDGGGWTLGIKSWYGQHHHFDGNGRRQTNNINSGVMDHLGSYYKMDDNDIRTYIGQPNPTADGNNNKASMFSYMRDQSGYNNYYSSFNRQYTVHKKYTARWFFSTGPWTNVKESTTETEFSSYYWPQHWNNDPTNPPGDGKLNWRGVPICGNIGGAGISCRYTHSGKPQKNPDAGFGCEVHLGQHRNARHPFHDMMCWSNYDTYLSVCQGEQHSSSNRFSSRVWFRSPDSQKEW